MLKYKYILKIQERLNILKLEKIYCFFYRLFFYNTI